jgi:hypothetical protein
LGKALTCLDAHDLVTVNVMLQSKLDDKRDKKADQSETDRPRKLVYWSAHVGLTMIGRRFAFEYEYFFV